jgi:LMBR1-like membrane protein
MASSAASDVFAIISLLLISLVVLLLLRHFLPLRTAPAYLLVPIFLSLALPASVVLLVPIDLASSARSEDEASKGVWLPDRVMLVSWRIAYWLTFVLTWLILPLLGEYIDAGYREPKDRFLYSLRSNGRYQLIVLSCAIAGLVYITISNGFDFTAVKALIMALAYVWGLILAIYLMGHGLVALPRKMFRNANTSGRLRRVQSRAPKVHEKLEDAIATLQDLEAQVSQLRQRKTGTARNFQEWIDELADLTGVPESRVVLLHDAAEPVSKVPAVITDRYMADLSRRLARARHQRARYVDEWDRIVQRASDFQTILDSKASKKLSFGRPSSNSSFISRYALLTPRMRFHLHIHIIPGIRIALGSLFALASVAIIWSEIIKFPAPQLSAVSLTVIHHPNNDNYQIGFGGQLIAAAWICYMCTCALSSVNDVPVWGQRALVRRNTYGESACWYAGQIAKLTVPLSYNFLTFLPRHIHKETTFYHFLGRLINLTPLGTGFDYFFPIFILLPVCATLFNLYGKIKSVFGFGILEDEDEEENPSGFGTGGWREGRDLIARDLSGAGTSSIGLLDSPRPSIDTARPSRVAPTLRVPPAQRSSAEPAARASAAVRSRPELDPETEEESIFTLFGRRVKNTVDSIDRPKWMQNSPSGSGFKRPKWLGGSDNEGSDSRQQTGRGIGSLFGSRSNNGQITI